jgi:hypothetical protein
MAIHTVFSVDGSLFLRWQSDLLAYSHKKVGQPGALTRLYSASKTPSPFDGNTFQTQPYSPHPVTNDDYPPYNKVGALGEWLALSPPEEDTVLFLDPDCIFLSACDEEVERGRPVSHPMLSMDVVKETHPEFVKRHGFQPDAVQGMGVPTLIHRDDLKALYPLFMEKTQEVRSDPASREAVGGGWTSDMWGYSFAAARLGLHHELRRLARWPYDPWTDLPFIHYAFSCEADGGKWQWFKSWYKPWERIEYPPDTPQAGAALFSLINEFAETREHATLAE